MHKLSAFGLPLPEIYICRNRAEAIPLLNAGIPCIISQDPDIDIVKAILYRTLRRKFPHIRWNQILHLHTVKRYNVLVDGGEVDGDPSPTPATKHTSADIAKDYRTFKGDGNKAAGSEVKLDASEYCADETAHVNIEQLQALGFLPKFMADAADAIRINLENRMQWRECYNKKLGACVGDVDYGAEAANLIILDVSGSIPEGISATMLQLIATLKEQANAELIVTGSTSYYFDRNCELPSPNKLRKSIGYGNEMAMFFQILNNFIAGRHFGNVISFGDYDTPFACTFTKLPHELHMEGTKVERVMHYHTRCQDQTGYARWCRIVSPDCEEVFDTTWCEVMY